MGGEHSRGPSRSSRSTGSSPHGRGTYTNKCQWHLMSRVIPAWAGNIYQGNSKATTQAGHPRMGGEHTTLAGSGSRNFGSSPHGRGTCVLAFGSVSLLRVIPAWAGNIRRKEALVKSLPGHPRMGGEHSETCKTASMNHGSSPHGRGTFGCGIVQHDQMRVIPAWAGNMNRSPVAARRNAGHPRMGGEHIGHKIAAGVGLGSSPHGRGTFH